jgi:hypothetical protein
MTAAAKSVCYFGYYLYLVGLTLLIAPNFLLSTFRLPETNEVWIRVVGVLVVGIGFYYHRSGVDNNSSFLKLTIPTRIFVFLCFSVFVIMGLVAPVFLVFGVVDLLGAVWTYISFRNEK